MNELSLDLTSAKLRNYHLHDWEEAWPFPLHASLQRFYDHFLGLRSADNFLIPREKFDPLDMPSLMPYLQILEVHPQKDGSNRYFFRLQGSAFANHHGFDATGRYLDTILPEPNLNIANRHYQDQLLTGKAAFLSGQQVIVGREFYLFERIMVPVCAQNQLQQLIGCWYWYNGPTALI